MTSVIASHSAVFLGTGFVFGTIYLFLLQQTVRIFVGAGSPIRIVLLYLMRLFLTMVVFWFAVQSGPIALVLTFGGFLGARMLAQFSLGNSWPWK